MLKTGTKLKLKNGFTIEDPEMLINSLTFPIWEIGYSNLNDSEKFFDIIPLQRFSPLPKINQITDMNFFLEIAKNELLNFFDLIG